MTDVELSPTLVARLGVLESHVLNPEVAEILIAGPGQIYVTLRGRPPEPLDIDFDDAAVRSLASRLRRALGKGEQRATRSGQIAPGLHASVVGTPRGDRAPVIRFIRRAPPDRTLGQLAAAGVLDRDAELRLLDACRNRRSIVIIGHAGSGRTDLLAALARIWQEGRRVAVLDGGEGRLATAGIGHVTLEPEVGAEGAALIGADVIVADDPPGPLLADLITFGRPFLATVEAVDAQSALDRMVAYCLTERSTASQIAGMAMVESSVGLVVELERAGPIGSVRSISEPWRADGVLTARRLLRPDVDDERVGLQMPAGGAPMTQPHDLASRPGPGSDLRSVVAISREITRSHVVDSSEFDVGELSEIRPEQLMSASFVGRLADVAEDRKPEPSSETNGLPPRPAPPPREASERTPTVIGPAEDQADPENYFEEETRAPDPPAEDGAGPPGASFGDETRPPDRPAEKEVGSPEVDFEDDTRAPDEMTMNADAGEMVDGELPPFDEAEEKMPSATAPAVPDDEQSWDHEAPSEVMQHPPIGGPDPDTSEMRSFENGRTPHEPLVDQQENDGLTHEEIEEMLGDLEEVVDGLEESAPKAKRRNRRAR